MEMVRALDAVLLRPREAELAPPTDAAREADAYEAPHPNVIVAARTDGHDPAHALVAADMREFDICDEFSVCVGSCTQLCVEI